MFLAIPVLAYYFSTLLTSEVKLNKSSCIISSHVNSFPFFCIWNPVLRALTHDAVSHFILYLQWFFHIDGFFNIFLNLLLNSLAVFSVFLSLLLNPFMLYLSSTVKNFSLVFIWTFVKISLIFFFCWSPVHLFLNPS